MRRFATLTPRRRVAVVCPDDEPTLGVINRCVSDGLAYMELIAPEGHHHEAARIAAAYPGSAALTLTSGKDEAAASAVSMIHQGRVDVILKGNINTDNLLHAVLDRESGLLPRGRVMSHVAVTQIPGRDRLLVFSDAAVIPEPTLEQLDSIIRYDTELCRRLGISDPAVALIHFTEKFNDRFPITTRYAELIRRADRGDYGAINLGGPMDVKCACDLHSAQIKGLKSEVAGRADLLIFPDLVAANTFYKTLSLFCHADMAAILTGTIAPVVVPSRADSDESKLLSLALACVTADSPQ